MSRNKNVSSKYRNGTRVQTRDEYLENTKYFSDGHPNHKDLYRGTYIIDSNKNDELVLVPLTTHRGRSPKGTTSEYIRVFDNKGNPIKIDGIRFVALNRRSISKQEVNKRKKEIFKESKRGNFNKYLVHRYIKKRTKKKRQ